MYIQRALNDAFGLEYNEIFLTDSEDQVPNPSIMYNDEIQTMAAYPEDNLYLYGYGTPQKSADFVVNVPDFLSDKIKDIRVIVEQNKPAGRIYELKIYNYE